MRTRRYCHCCLNCRQLILDYKDSVTRCCYEVILYIHLYMVSEFWTHNTISFNRRWYVTSRYAVFVDRLFDNYRQKKHTLTSLNIQTLLALMQWRYFKALADRMDWNMDLIFIRQYNVTGIFTGSIHVIWGKYEFVNKITKFQYKSWKSF